jgi:hypothetical protein
VDARYQLYVETINFFIPIFIHRLFTVDEKKEQALQKIINAKGKVQTEIVDLKDKLKLAKETIVKFKEEIAKIQGHQIVNLTIS